jgi:hypothetical protein
MEFFNDIIHVEEQFRELEFDSIIQKYYYKLRFFRKE